MAGGIISSAIGAVDNVIGNIFGNKSTSNTNKTNMAINKMNNEFNANEAEKARQYQTEMWEKTNTYNTPLAQRQRNIAAGLNPYMSVDGSNAASVSNAPQGSAGQPNAMQPYRYDFNGLSSAIASGLQLENETKLSNASVSNLQGQKNLADAQAQKTLSTVDWGKLGPAYKAWSQMTGVTRAQLGMDTDKANLDNVRWLSALTKAQRTNILLDNKAKAITNKYLDEGSKLQLDMAAQRYINLQYSGALTYEQVRHEMAKRVQTLVQTQGQRIDNKMASSIADSYIEAMRTQYSVESESNKGLLPYAGAKGQYYNTLLKNSSKMSNFDFSTRYLDKFTESVNRVGNGVGSAMTGAAATRYLKKKK